MVRLRYDASRTVRDDWQILIKLDGMTGQVLPLNGGAITA